MPTFAYKARTDKGELQKGTVEASNKTLAEQTLHQQGLIVVSLESEEKPALLESPLDFLNPIRSKDKVLFFRQLATMIEATLPIVQAMKILAKQAKNKKFQRAITNIVREVEGGSALSAAFSQHPNVFSEFQIGMIKSGEISGNLDKTLIYLSDQMEKDYDLTSKVKGAMIYPAFIVVGIIVVGFLMMVYVIPQLTSVLEESGQELPITTRILIASSKAMKNYWWVIVGGAVAFVAGLRFFGKRPRGKYLFDLLKIKVPIVNILYKKLYLVRLTRNLGTLLAGGLPIGEALRIVSGVMDNGIYREACLRVKQGVESGESLTRIFRRETIFPTIISQMVHVGERTGRLVDVLQKLAQFYDREVAIAMKSLVSLIEPIIMVIMGIAVAIMVSAILMPIYNMANAV